MLTYFAPKCKPFHFRETLYIKNARQRICRAAISGFLGLFAQGHQYRGNQHHDDADGVEIADIKAFRFQNKDLSFVHNSTPSAQKKQ